jgi:SRF-type transcription factor (DNA-binding and dimerisation domain)
MGSMTKLLVLTRILYPIFFFHRRQAYELSTLTGTQVLLLVVSETGLVYTFTTVKLQPIVTKPEGKNLIQACLNAPDAGTEKQEVWSGFKFLGRRLADNTNFGIDS